MRPYQLPTSADGGRSFAVAGGWVAEGPMALVSAAFVWLLMVIMIAPDGLNYIGMIRPGSGLGLRTHALIQLGVLGVGGCILLWRLRLALLLVRWLNPLLIAFLAWMLASAAWSMFPGFTVQKFVRVMVIMIGCFSFALLGWYPQRFQMVLRSLVTWFLFGSLLFGLLMPSVAIHQSDRPELLGAWRGLTTQKNQLGSVAAVGVMLWMHGWAAREVPRWQAVLGVLLSGVLLVLSRSSTSLMVAAFASLFLVVLLRVPAGWTRLRPTIVAAFTGIVVVYSLVVLDKMPGGQLLLKPVAMITGKDMSFTGRAPIWEVIYDQIEHHKLKGIGYGAYWVGDDPWSPAYEMVTRVYFYPGSAHNGYLDIVNDLGLIGLGLLIGFLLLYILQAMALFRVEPAQGALYLAIVFQQGLGNLSESYILYYQSPHIVFMLLATVCMARAQLEVRLRQLFGMPSPEVEPGTDPVALPSQRPSFPARPLEWDRT